MGLAYNRFAAEQTELGDVERLEIGEFGPLRGQDVGELMAYGLIMAIAVTALLRINTISLDFVLPWIYDYTKYLISFTLLKQRQSKNFLFTKLQAMKPIV